MVTKTRSYTVDTSFMTHDYTQVGNNPLPPPVRTNRRMLCFKSMTHSGSVKGWKQKIQRGTDATSGFMGQTEQAVLSPGMYVFESETLDQYGGPVMKTHQERSGNLVGEPSFVYPGSVSTSQAQNEAKMKFVRAIQREQTALQGMVTVGELGQALAMIRRPGEALRRGLGDYIRTAKRRRNRSSARDRARVVSGTWLEYVFGWRPLISDIKAGAEALAKLQYGEPETRYVKVYAERGQHGPFWPFYSDKGLFTEVTESRTIQKAKVIMRGVVSTNPATGPRSLSIFGVSWNQVIPTAWELIPYSFVADYFANIGDMLAANAINMSSIRWWNQAILRESVTTNAFVAGLAKKPGPLERYTQQFYSPGSIVATSKLVERSVGTGSLVPTFEFRVPFCDTQWINLSALFAQARG